MTSNLYNGPSTAGEGNYYLGDKAMYVSDTITIQLHHITFDNSVGVETATISIFYPQHLSTEYTTNS